MSYTYGACCCSSGWYDVYWPGADMIDHDDSQWTRTSNSDEVDPLETSRDTTPAWTVDLTYPLDDVEAISLGASAYRSVSVYDGTDEKVWVVYPTSDAGGDWAFANIDAATQTEEFAWVGNYDHPFGSNASAPPGWGGGASGDLLLLHTAQPGILFGGGSTASITKPYRRCIKIANSAVSVDTWAKMDTTGTPVSRIRTSGGVSSVTLAGAIGSTTPSWSSNAWPHSVSLRNYPKCAGVRIVWNSISSTAYDFDVEIVEGEISSSLFAMTVDSTIVSTNYTGTINEPGTTDEQKDAAFLDAGSPMAYVWAYIKARSGDYMILYDAGNGEIDLYHNTTKVVDDPGPHLLGSVSYSLANVHLFEPRATIPGDTGDRVLYGLEYARTALDPGSSLKIRRLEIYDDTHSQVWAGSRVQSGGFGGLATPSNPCLCNNGSDMYVYYLDNNPEPRAQMLRIDGDFTHQITQGPLADPQSSTEPQVYCDVVKHTDLDSLTPPMVESELT